MIIYAVWLAGVAVGVLATLVWQEYSRSRVQALREDWEPADTLRFRR